MRVIRPHIACIGLLGGAIGLTGVVGCVQSAPPDLVQAVESLDRQLVTEQGAEFAPEEYARFASHWVAVKGRLNAEEDLIRWPWEPDTLTADLRRVQEEGLVAVSIAAQRRETERQQTEAQLETLERRLQRLRSRVDEIGSRLVLGQRPMVTDLLAKQARMYVVQGLYSRAQAAIEEASALLDEQRALLTTELGRYADPDHVAAWRRAVQETVNWSRTHRAVAIVVSKADRRLTLYRNGRPVATYPVRLGFNAMVEKRHQGDGATPEGAYRVVRKRDRGQTRFYRALLLDYPNARDRHRFQEARRQGALPASAFIGGQIEIHGDDDTTLSQTLGCIMLANHEIDVLFQQTHTGTPVTIVGALQTPNAVSLALANLEVDSEQDDTMASEQRVMEESAERG